MEVKLNFDTINVFEENNPSYIKVLMLKGEKGDKGDPGSIVNEYSTSTSDAYSANYTNQNMLKKEDKNNMGDIVVDSVTGKNLFDKDNNTNYLHWFIYLNGSIGYDANTMIRLIQIPIKGGTTYTISKIAGSRFRASTSNKNFNEFDSSIQNPVNAQVSNDTGTTITITSTANDKYLYLTIGDDDTAYNTMKQSTMIEIGNQATDYVPFKKYGYNSEESMGNIVVDDIQGKNLISMRDGAITSYSTTVTRYNDKININGTPTQSAYISFTRDMEFKAGITYTISSNINLPSGITIYTNNTGNIGLGYNDTKIEPGSKSKSFTPTQTGKINFALLIGTNFSGSSTDLYIQIEKGSEATSYVPYKSFDSTAYVLWTNSSPTSVFAGQQITLNDSLANYKYYEILCMVDAYTTRMISTGRILNTYGTLLFIPSNGDTGTVVNRSRTVNNGTTTLTFGDCTAVDTKNQTYSASVTDRLIPYQVIAYK